MEVKAILWGYEVDTEGTSPRFHIVSTDGRCSCGKNGQCPAVLAVAIYLGSGGERAKPRPDDFWATAPAQCPICGSQTLLQNVKNLHGVVWKCVSGAGLHYWQARQQAKNRLVDIIGIPEVQTSWRDSLVLERSYREWWY